MPAGLRWLDVGCGTGAFTELVLEQANPREVSTVDPAEDQIAYARTKPLAKHVDFRLSGVQTLPFADREFDVAAMALVITFIPDPAQAIAEMKRVVEPGGIIGTYVWDFSARDTQQPLREAVEAMGIPVLPMPGHIDSRLENLETISPGPGRCRLVRPIEIEISYQTSTNTGRRRPVRQHRYAAHAQDDRSASRRTQSAPARASTPR